MPRQSIDEPKEQLVFVHSLAPAEPLVRAMLKIAGRAGVGVFATVAAIRGEVQSMYGVELVGKIPSIKERFYAISAERRIKHPGIRDLRSSA